MRYHSRNCLVMARKLMNKFFLIRAPLPYVKLAKLKPSDESLVIVHDNHISDEIFFDR
jgi:hypothetical protein